eukprot:TRINITY_DN14967_c0_g1_i1.p1 TRINITY_DN14967_c0_g1~~TRINITY_DN14967_c0_g1_i1.p1  ORF type:complete len:183 (-),score=56.97 TRINITY_DN14967_c0_g1_i1:108-656(-)
MLLLVLVSCVALTTAQDNIENVEKAENVLKELKKSSGLDLNKSFRCGMFFPDPKDETKVPISPLLVFNATWSAEECPAGDTKRHNAFCDKLFSKFTTTLSLKDPSLRAKRRAKGVTIGDDICTFLKEEVKAPFVGPKSKKFPKGLEIGMFSSACGSKEKWHFTGMTHGERVCCRAGKYIPCL